MLWKERNNLVAGLAAVLAAPGVLLVFLAVMMVAGMIIPINAGAWWAAYSLTYRGYYFLALISLAVLLARKYGYASLGFWLSVAAAFLALREVPVQSSLVGWTLLTQFPPGALALAAVAFALQTNLSGWRQIVVALGAWSILTWELFQYVALAVAPQALASFWQHNIILQLFARWGGWLSFLLLLFVALSAIQDKDDSKGNSNRWQAAVAFVLITIITSGGLSIYFSNQTPAAYTSYSLEIVPDEKVSQLLVQFPLPLYNGRVPAAFLRRASLHGANGGELAIVLTPYGRMGQLKVPELKQPLKVFWDEQIDARWLAGEGSVPLALQPRYEGGWERPLSSLAETKALGYAKLVSLPLFASFNGKAVRVNISFELTVPGIKGSGYRQIFCQYVPMEYENGYLIRSGGWQLLPIIEEVLVKE